jgi:hypothetical protein
VAIVAYSSQLTILRVRHIVLSDRWGGFQWRDVHVKFNENHASELYRPSDRRLSHKLVPALADRGCHVVSATDPHGH